MLYEVITNQKFTLSVDYSLEYWKGLTIFNDNYKMFNSSLLGVGMEFCSDEYSKTYVITSYSIHYTKLYEILKHKKRQKNWMDVML